MDKRFPSPGPGQVENRPVLELERSGIVRLGKAKIVESRIVPDGAQTL
jgi:hypothetical protein